FKAGGEYRERAAIAANRVGKTEGIGAYETTCHLTGKYPDWWCGHRFDHPIQAWVAGDTNTTTRDILQAKLLGKMTREDGDDPRRPLGLGTGMIPVEAIGGTRLKSGLPNAIESAYIKHRSGGVSTLSFKSYEQGRKAFQGTEVDVVWFDEEPPIEIYSEAVTRTMATGSFQGGILLLTFTPLSGWSHVVGQLLNEKLRTESGRFVIMMGWDDAPHLSQQEKEDMLRRYHPHERDSRSKGIPQLGSGAIYPVPESEILVDPFEIPKHWPRAYALDIGWNWTATIWGAQDRDSDTTYLYAELKVGQMEPEEVARRIRAHGAWIPGVIDPSANGRKLDDGRQMIALYREHGLDLESADNSVHAGVQDVWDRLVANRLKVFRSNQAWLEEFRMYRRDDKGRIVKQNDHLMDSTRYYVRSGMARGKCGPLANNRGGIFGCSWFGGGGSGVRHSWME